VYPGGFFEEESIGDIQATVLGRVDVGDNPMSAQGGEGVWLCVDCGHLVAAVGDTVEFDSVVKRGAG
jgi:hypothetical protein